MQGTISKAVGGWMIVLAMAGAARGETAPAADGQEELKKIRQFLERQERELGEQRRRLREIEGTLAKPEKVGADAQKGELRPDQKEAERKVAEATTIFDQPGVLSPRGTLTVEPSFQYSLSTSNRIALLGYSIIPSITIGVIDVRKVESNSMVAALALRYGLANRIEVEAKVPYVYRYDSSLTRKVGEGAQDDTVFSAEGYGLGDVEFGIRYQVNRPNPGGVYCIAGLRVKTPTGQDIFDIPVDSSSQMQTDLATGSGFWGIQPSLSILFPSDPVVIFGGASYLWNVERQVDSSKSGITGRFDPGDAIGINFGMGLALNEKLSFSIGYDHSVIGKEQKDGQVLPNSDFTHVGSLLIGYSYRFSDKTSLSISIGAGMTESAPDVQLTVRMPYSM